MIIINKLANMFKKFNQQKNIALQKQKSDLKDDPSPPLLWSVHKLSDTASRMLLKLNKLYVSWPRISTTIYPGQTLRVNTGWANKDFPENMTLNIVPHKSLIQNNLISVPQIMDYENQGQQIVQQVLNNNPYPVKIDFQLNQDGQDTFTLQKLHGQTLQMIQVLEWDWGSFFTTIAQIAIEVLPFLI